jgi:hypothetical protein
MKDQQRLDVLFRRRPISRMSLIGQESLEELGILEPVVGAIARRIRTGLITASKIAWNSMLPLLGIGVRTAVICNPRSTVQAEFVFWFLFIIKRSDNAIPEEEPEVAEGYSHGPLSSLRCWSANSIDATMNAAACQMHATITTLDIVMYMPIRPASSALVRSAR